jgi:hypothetical protein
MILKKVFGAFIVVAALAVSCGKLQEKPVVDFAMKSFKVESRANCDESDSIPCASFEVQYPVFLSLDTNVRNAISNRVAYIINGSQGETKSLEQTGGDFLKDFEAFMKEMPNYGLSWYFIGHVDVMVASDTLISLEVSSESFTGGVHASYTTNYVNIDPKTGTAYLLDAMLRAGYEDELNRLASEDVQEQLGLTGNDSIDGPDFPQEPFKLNENYGFRKEGIVFFFNEHELPSFAEGPTEILIPYEKLQGWIK